jgi:hypothetical protein
MSTFRLKQAYCRRFHFRQFLKYIETTSVETLCQAFSTAGKVYVMKLWKNYTHSYLRWIALLLFMTSVKNIITCDASWAVLSFSQARLNRTRSNFIEFLTAEVSVDRMALGQVFHRVCRFSLVCVVLPLLHIQGQCASWRPQFHDQPTRREYMSLLWPSIRSSSQMEPDSFGVNDKFGSGVGCRPYPSVLTWKSVVVGINYEVGERIAKYTFREPSRIVSWCSKLRPHCDCDRLWNGTSRN